MLVRCWGARGSIPVSGPEYLKYGGDTTCMELRTRDDDIIVVDAGSGIRRLGNLLLKEGRTSLHMFFTHAHWDHVLGLPFFKPIYSPDTHINIKGCPFNFKDLRGLLSQVMSAPYFPVPYASLLSTLEHDNICDLDSRIGPVRVTTIPLNHPNQGRGYRFEEDGKRFVFLTDNELDFQHEGGRSVDEYTAFAEGADLLIHDAEYRLEEYDRLTRGWGHSWYKHALELAINAKVKRFGLFHHNQDRPDKGVDAMVAECRRILDERGVDMECFAVAQHMELHL